MSDTRTRILEAALASFTHKGVAATTIGDIRERSGASTGSIYHHFGSKEGMAATLYVEGLASYHAAALEQIAARPPAHEAIPALVSHHLHWIQRHPDLSRFLLNTRQAEFMADQSDTIRAANKRFIRTLSDWIRFEVSVGRLRDLPADVYLPLILGPSHELARHWLAGRIRTPLTTCARALAEAAWRSLAPGERDD